VVALAPKPKKAAIDFIRASITDNFDRTVLSDMSPTDMSPIEFLLATGPLDESGRPRFMNAWHPNRD
jgi:hypothetical protein